VRRRSPSLLLGAQLDDPFGEREGVTGGLGVRFTNPALPSEQCDRNEYEDDIEAHKTGPQWAMIERDGSSAVTAKPTIDSARTVSSSANSLSRMDCCQ
jgi:hypothetical protein